MTVEYDAIIVGAGLSGLSCAKALTAKNKKVLVLEADKVIGGRVQSIKDFEKGVILECGAGMLHGQNTSLFSICKELKIEVDDFFCVSQGDGGPDSEPVNGCIGVYYVKDKNGTLNRYPYNTKDKNFIHAHNVYHNINNIPKEDRNKSYLKYLKEQNVSSDMISLLESGGSNTCCTTLSNLSLEKMIEWNRFWCDQAGEDDCEGYMLPPHCFSDVINYLAKNIDIKTLHPVDIISITEAGVDVTVSEQNLVFQAKTVVVSSSIGVLKDKLIQFNPPLSNEKVEALESVSFNHIVKLFVVFSKRFWPKNIDGFVCAGFPIPEIWPDSYGKKHVFTGFATTDFADNLLKFSDDQIIDIFLEELKELFSGFKQKYFIKGMVYRWDKVNKPYIRGGYGAPLFSDKFNPRYTDILSTPIDNKIFFCGEGVNINEGSTAPAAIDSGVFASKQVLSTF